MSPIRAGLVLVLGIFLTAGAATAQPWPIIRFGLTADYPPFAQRLPDGSLTGADVEIARRVAAELGAEPQFILTTWAELEPQFAAGRFDVAIGGLTVTPGRAALGHFTRTILEDGKRPMARCADLGRYGDLAAIDQPGVRVIINAGPQINRLAAQWITRAQIIVEPDESALAGRLLRHEADVWIGDGVGVDLTARRYPGLLCATARTPFTHLEKAWLVRRDQALFAAVDGRLGAALDDGAWRRAFEAVR